MSESAYLQKAQKGRRQALDRTNCMMAVACARIPDHSDRHWALTSFPIWVAWAAQGVSVGHGDLLGLAVLEAQEVLGRIHGGRALARLTDRRDRYRRGH